MIDTGQPEAAFALDVVTRACHLCERIQTGMALQGLTKSDFSPVTVADFAVQALVGRTLGEAFPDDVLVGEENAAQLQTDEGAKTREVVTRFVSSVADDATDDRVCAWIDRGAGEPAERFWVLDPVDGTKGYLRGGQYAVALALIENGKVAMGVLGCPNLGEGCLPDMGVGAVLIARRGEGTWCSVAQGRVLRSIESGHTNVSQIDTLVQTLGVEAEPVLMDSQAKYAVLAGASGELLFRLLSPRQPDYKEKIWDQAAGSIVLEEAGGRITDLAGRPLDFTQGRTLANNTGVFASNGLLHDAGIEAIAKVCAPA